MAVPGPQSAAQAREQSRLLRSSAHRAPADDQLQRNWQRRRLPPRLQQLHPRKNKEGFPTSTPVLSTAEARSIRFHEKPSGKARLRAEFPSLAQRPCSQPHGGFQIVAARLAHREFVAEFVLGRSLISFWSLPLTVLSRAVLLCDSPLCNSVPS